MPYREQGWEPDFANASFLICPRLSGTIWQELCGTVQSNAFCLLPSLSQSSSAVTRKMTNASWLPRDFIFHEDSQGQQLDCAYCLTDAVKLRKMKEGRTKWQVEASHFGAIWTRDFGAEVSLWVIDPTKHCFYRQNSRSWHAFKQRISHCKSCPQLWGRHVAESCWEATSNFVRPSRAEENCEAERKHIA